MNKKSNESKNFFTTIGKEILRLEFKTDSGRINFVALVILALFSVIITANEWILKLVHLIGSFAVEFKNGHAASIEYETTSSLVMILIFVVAAVLCIAAVYSMDRALKKAKKEEIEDASE